MLMTHPVMTPEQAQSFEHALLVRRESQWGAVEQAGRAVGHGVYRDFHELAQWPARPRLLLLVGKGHNGADCLMAGLELRERLPNAEVFVLPAAPRPDWRSLTRKAMHQLEEAGEVNEINLATAVTYLFDLCLDGVLGMRSQPPLKDDLRELFQAMNAHKRIGLRVSVDLPSGLGDEAAFRADFTYATGIVKAPVLLPEHAETVGRLRYADIGFFEGAAVPPPDYPDRVCADVIMRSLLQLRSVVSDKRTHGHLAILGGHRTMPGALLMNVQAALRAGTGLVTAFAPESVAAALAAAAPEAMWVPVPETPDGGIALEAKQMIERKLTRATVLLMGSGMGDEAETTALCEVLAATVASPLVLDADALRPGVLAALGKRMGEGPQAILTPHHGEFERLRPGTFGAVANESLRAFCQEHRCVTILKSHRSRVSSATQTAISCTGGPVLARGGSGDVLAGLVAGLLAQAPDDLFLTACQAQHWYGLAADHLARCCGHQAVVTSDLLPVFGQALREL